MRNCTLPTSYKQNRTSIRCGEIICYDNVNFTIICVLCKMKLFEFEDFMVHYQNVHLRGNIHDSDSDNDADGELEECIKDEEFENVEYLAELDECGVRVGTEVQPARILDEVTSNEKQNVPIKTEIIETTNNDTTSEYSEVMGVDNSKLNEFENEEYDDEEWAGGPGDDDNYILKKVNRNNEVLSDTFQVINFFSLENPKSTHVHIAKNVTPQNVY